MEPIVIPKRSLPLLSLPIYSLPVAIVEVAVRPRPLWRYTGGDFFELKWIRPVGIATEEAFGRPVVLTGIVAAGIESAETVGRPRIVMVAELSLAPSGSVTGEMHGTPLVVLQRNVRREESEIMTMLMAA